MSVHTLFIIAIGGGVLMVVALIGFVASLIVDDRRANREDREQHGHARPRESWRTRFQAWMTDHYGQRTGVSLWRRFLAWVYAPVNVPALVTTLPPGTSAGTPTSQRPPRAAVTRPAGARAESGRAEPPVPGLGGAPSTVHHFAALAWQYAGDNARSGCWPMGAVDADTGYSKKDAALLGVILEGDAATVQIRRRFADLEVRDQARFARITAGIKAGAA